MKIHAELEIDSEGILKKMQEVRIAKNRLRTELDELDDMMQRFVLKEKGDSQESPKC